MRRRTPLLALPALLVAVVVPLQAPPAAATAAPSATAVAPDFYRAPSPLPRAAPGTILRSRRAAVQLGVGAPAVKAWTVMYHSRDTTGAGVPVTGTVLTPTAPWTGGGPRPVVGFAVGTQGPGPQCAPSKQLVAGTEYEDSSISQALRRGWAVAVTDYEGYTTGDRATYVTGRSEGHAVLDVVRAAQKLPGSGVRRDAPLLLWGYSQGGGASTWATVLQPSYAPELRLRATAAGGVPADAKAVGDSLNGNVGAAFLLYSLSGFAEAYPTRFPLAANLNAAGKATVAAVNTQCVSDSLARYAFRDVGSYLKAGTTVAQFQAIPSVAAVLAENTITGKPMVPKVPVLQYHGLADEIVPLGQALELRRAWCRRDVAVTFVGVPGEHLTASVQAAPLAVQFLADRLAGRPFPVACPAVPGAPG